MTDARFHDPQLPLAAAVIRRMKFLAIVSLTVLVSASVHAALDKAYFNRLSTEKVTSSDLVTWTQIGPGMAGYCATGRRHLTAERSIVCKTQ